MPIVLQGVDLSYIMPLVLQPLDMDWTNKEKNMKVFLDQNWSGDLSS